MESTLLYREDRSSPNNNNGDSKQNAPRWHGHDMYQSPTFVRLFGTYGRPKQQVTLRKGELGALVFVLIVIIRTIIQTHQKLCVLFACHLTAIPIRLRTVIARRQRCSRSKSDR